MNSRHWIYWMPVVTFGAVVGPAVAQDAAGVEEIVVTAQKRQERLIDVPSSIAAVGDQTIKDLNVQQLAELSNHVPNLIIDSNVSLNSAVYIRGVGANSRNIGFDTRVGVYLDGVYLGQSPALNQELVDLERVEVLRGPQGALFGKNTVAGAINLVSRQPTFDTETFVSARVGDYGERQGSLRFNTALGSTVATKISFNRAVRDGFTTNLFDGSDVGNRDATSGRAQLRWDVSDSLKVLASVDGLRTRERGEYGNAFTNTFGSAIASNYSRPRTINVNHNSADERDVYRGALDIAYELAGGSTFKSITSYRSTEFASTIDVDYSPLDLVSVDFADEYRQYTQEFQWLAARTERFEYLAGLYLYQQDSDTSRAARTHSQAPLLGLPAGASLPTAGDVTTRNAALYAHGTYDLTDKLEFGLGFRWSWEEKEANYAIDGSRLPAFGLATGTFSDKRTDEDLSPTATLTYQWTPNFISYLRYAEGYKSGGYNLDFVGPRVFPNSLEFERETARNYEAGIKGDLWQRRLGFAISVFRTEFENYQVDQFLEVSPGVIAIVIGNAAEVRTQGVELEATLRPIDRLTLGLGLGVLKAEFESFPGGGAGNTDASGKELPGASPLQANASVGYSVPIGRSLDLLLHADYTYRDRYYSDIDNRTSVTVGGMTVPYDRVSASDSVNARIAIAPQSQRWEFAVWSRNLLDSRNVAIYGGDFFGTLTRRYAAPRTWGAEISAKF
ncbi:TonB-dependent receptor [Steroidobacter sp.]|uniref:TonB-dependent receptor n=1 Tax=Steroidobacter sp. TaxID=1978227 RepID=UPI001A60B3DB|nr:TonB-dependent receptor [Steroidobacter sp.]MBL8268000.1 TonB-dependent receptor [Steroidobacter sp.]